MIVSTDSSCTGRRRGLAALMATVAVLAATAVLGLTEPAGSAEAVGLTGASVKTLDDLAWG